MALNYGFFDAVRTVDPETGEVSFDRTYDSESMNKYFKGIISQNGVFSNVGDRFLVSAVTGQMRVVVGTGKGIIATHWADLTAAEPIDVPAPDLVGDRYDAVMLRFNGTTGVDPLKQRTCELYIKSGVAIKKEPNSPEPPKPAAEGNVDGIFDMSGGPVEMPLAYIYVKKNASGISQSDIVLNVGTDLCPWISHLVNGPKIEDVDALLASYLRSFRNWYSQVTEEMNVNTHLQEFRKVVNGGSGVSKEIPLNMDGYTYGAGDLLWVSYNGLDLIRDIDYAIQENDDHTEGTVVLLKAAMSAGNTLIIRVMKSVIGTPTYLDGDEVRY